jgi:5-hydroxyisourate hydrolase-like protein (transthyretin family)
MILSGGVSLSAFQVADAKKIEHTGTEQDGRSENDLNKRKARGRFHVEFPFLIYTSK